jgi:hypothetical protein
VIESGDVGKLLDGWLNLNLGRSKGRGSLSNLPAWVVQKQKEQKQQELLQQHQQEQSGAKDQIQT